ncbi:MAG: ABC transporter permease [Flavobacterium sp. BFFFF2]|nr:MAG: ABC transporter permease [Flavobacterium sp. BFFFF2]
MIRLSSIEWNKVWKNRSNRILLIGYFLILSLIALIASIKFNVGNVVINPATQGAFDFPYIWHLTTFIAGILKFFLALVVVSMITNEYTYNTLKQNLIDGLTKAEFIATKSVVIVGLSLASMLFVMILTFTLGMIFSSYDDWSLVFTDWQYLGAYFLKLVGFYSFCLFLGLLFKRSAIAIAFLVLWSIAEGIIYVVLSKLVFTQGNWATYIHNCMPLEALANLIKEPFTRFSAVKTIGQAVGENMMKDYSVPLSAVLIVLVWIVIFHVASYKILKRRDL